MATVNNTLETLLNERDVARITGLSVASVRRWRLLGQGPRYVKLGAAVRYKADDISAWLESRPTGGGVKLIHNCDSDAIRDSRRVVNSLPPAA